jgi:hypothetical protein
MKLKKVILEDFINYKVPSMFLITSYCDWKCCTEAHCSIDICQNSKIINEPIIDISPQNLYEAYVNNDISKAIVFGGLEPMLQIDEVIDVIKYFREQNINDAFVIYTGYYFDEIEAAICRLKKYKNIIIKYGRFIPNQKPHYDEILGINLASDNQYGSVIS